MDTTPILLKPAHLPALPGFDKFLGSLRFAAIAMFVQPVLLVGVAYFLEFSWLIVGLLLLSAVLSFGYFGPRFLRSRAEFEAVHAGDLPVVTAFVDDERITLRAAKAAGANAILVVPPGEAVAVTVAPMQLPNQQTPSQVQWLFTHGDEKIAVTTWFDPDQPVLADVESRLERVGLKATVSHEPFAAA